MKTNIRGLHLWSVTLTGTNNTLWITTKQNRLETAISKARRFLSRNKRQWPENAAPSGAKNHGTLDA